MTREDCCHPGLTCDYNTKENTVTEPDPIDNAASQFQDAGDEYVKWTPPIKPPAKPPSPPDVTYDEHERQMLAVLAQRDAAYATADALAAKVAAGRWIGEHSSENNPWQNALDLPDLTTPARTPSPT